jgi:hypothetical protein
MFDISEHITDATHIKTSTEGEGPFFFYFAIQYNPNTVEGILGLQLYFYDEETLSFTQVASSTINQGLSEISTQVGEGTYVLEVQSMSSTEQKFNTETHVMLLNPQ